MTTKAEIGLPLNDPRWQSYSGGYKVPYDASKALRRLSNEGPSDDLWDEFWQELYHQGSIGPASYAAIPHLLEWVKQSQKLYWQVFSLVATIELARKNNEAPPPELEASYFQAIKDIPAWVGRHSDTAWNATLTYNIVTCIALAKEQHLLAEAYLELNEDMARKFLKNEFGRII